MTRFTAGRLGVLILSLALAAAVWQAAAGPILGGAQPPAASAVVRDFDVTAPLGPPSPVAAARQVGAAPAATGYEFSGQVVTQTFALKGGWNTIYLEVESSNASPLVDPDGAGPLPSQPVSSTLEAVFANLTCTGCLESVWTWNVPHSRMDYIIDPSEGLWDAAGWRRYYPAGAVGSDGRSLGFLTDMSALHGSTGYLVKLSDGAGDVNLAVAGRPLVRELRWLPGSYNLSGFPLLPETGVSVRTIMLTSAITDVRRLNNDGRWGPSLPLTTTLQAGESYLVYYSDQVLGAADDYSAPLNMRGVSSDGFVFTRGAAGARQALTVDNLLTATASITVSLAAGVSAPMVLQLTSPITKDLSTGPAVITLTAGSSALLRFQLPASQQLTGAEGLIQLASSALGTRRLIPFATKGSSVAGLWVGDVIADDVSESRLGSTNIPSGTLTVALGPRDGSGIAGAAEMAETVSGSTSSVAVTMTLALPSAKTTTPPSPVAGVSSFVGGYVFVDANQNGKRDADEMGIGGASVALTPPGEAPILSTTQPDGLYLFEALAAGSYSLSLATPPLGYTSTFVIQGQSDSTDVVGRWTFDEGGGAVALDSSGNGYNGTLVNGPVHTTERPPTVTFEDPYSLVFDGVNDMVSVSSSPVFSTPKFTVGAWINGTVWGANRTSNTIVTMDGGNRGWILRCGNYNGNAMLSFVMGTGTGWAEVTTQYLSQLMKPGVWYHVAGSYDGTTMRMFLNGAEIRSASVLTYSAGAAPVNIGRYPSGAAPFNGLIDDVRIYNRAFSGTQLRDVISKGSGPNRLPNQVTVDAVGVTDILPVEYKPQTLPAPYELPMMDVTGRRVEPAVNFGLVPAYEASLWTGTCANRLLKQASLGVVANGILNANLASAALNQPPAPVTYQLLGGAQRYVFYVEQAGGGGAAGQGVACGEIVVGAPTNSPFTFRVILRVEEDGRASLLPTYTITGEKRISSAAFSIPGPLAASGRFTDTNPSLAFTIVLDASDPLNPFRHKYAPDHDNLDALFNPINLEAVPPYMWESYEVRRDLTLELTQFPPGGGAQEAADLDWGGVNWGGLYREVIKGLHKNDITVKGYFVIRRVLTGDQLRPQSYDQP